MMSRQFHGVQDTAVMPVIIYVPTRPTPSRRYIGGKLGGDLIVSAHNNPQSPLSDSPVITS